MKKLSGLLAAVLILTLSAALSGCRGTELSAAEDEIVLSVSIDTEDDVYQIAAEYWAGDVFCGGIAKAHADGSRFDDGEVSSFVFDPSMFPENSLPETLAVSIMLSDDNEHMDIESLAGRVGFSEPCDYGPFDVSPGTVYRFILRGSFDEGFRISRESCPAVQK